MSAPVVTRITALWDVLLLSDSGQMTLNSLWARFLQVYFRSFPPFIVIIFFFFLSHFISGLSMWKSNEWRNINHLGSPETHLHSFNHNFWTRNSHLSEMGFPGGASGIEKKEWSRSVVSDSLWPHGQEPASGSLHSVPASGRSPGGGHGSTLQDSRLENPMDRGYSPWGAKSWTRLNWLSTQSSRWKAMKLTA